MTNSYTEDGVKPQKGRQGKSYIKIYRTMSYKVGLYLICDVNGWVIAKHNMLYIHPSIASDETYLLRVHRLINK